MITIHCYLVADELPETNSIQSQLQSLVSNDQLNAIAEQVQDGWQRLAAKFTVLDEDDLNYFKEKETPTLQATNMLTVWKVRFFVYPYNHVLLNRLLF